jgi:hypothetical protein
VQLAELRDDVEFLGHRLVEGEVALAVDLQRTCRWRRRT